MAVVIIDDREVEIGDAERLNGIQAAELRGRRHSALLLARRADGRRQLPDVPGRDRHEEQRDRQDHDAAEAGAGLPDAGQGRHGLRHRQRKGPHRPGRWSKKTC